MALKRPSSDTALGLTIGLPGLVGAAGTYLGYKWRTKARDKAYLDELAEGLANKSIRVDKRARGFSPFKGKEMWDMTAKKLAYPFPETITTPEGTVHLQHDDEYFWQNDRNAWKSEMDANEQMVKKWASIVKRNQEIAAAANEYFDKYSPLYGQGKKYYDATRKAVAEYKPKSMHYDVNYFNDLDDTEGTILANILNFNSPQVDSNDNPLGFTTVPMLANNPYTNLAVNGWNLTRNGRTDFIPNNYADGGYINRYADGGSQQRYSGSEYKVPSYDRGGASGTLDSFYDNFGGNFLGRRVRKGETEAIGAILGLPGFREDYEAKYGKPWNYALHNMLQGSFTPEVNDYLYERAGDAMKFANTNNNLRNWYLGTGDKMRSWFDQRSQVGSPLGFLGHRIGNWIDQWTQNLAPEQDAYKDTTTDKEYTYKAPKDRTNYYENAGGVPQDPIADDAPLWEKVKNYATNLYKKYTHIGDPDAYKEYNSKVTGSYANPFWTKPFAEWTEADLSEAIANKVIADPEKNKKQFDLDLKRIKTLANTVEGQSLQAIMGLYEDKTKNAEQIQSALNIKKEDVKRRIEANTGQTPTDAEVEAAIDAMVGTALAARTPDQQEYNKYDKNGNLYVTGTDRPRALGTLKDVSFDPKHPKYLEAPTVPETLPPINDPPKMTWAKVLGQTVKLSDGREVPKIVQVPVPPPAPRYDHDKAMEWFSRFNEPDQNGVQGTEYDPVTGQLKPHQAIELGPNDKAEGSDVFTRDFGNLKVNGEVLGNPDLKAGPDAEGGGYGNRFYRYDVRNLGSIDPNYKESDTKFGNKAALMYFIKKNTLPGTYAHYQAAKKHLPEDFKGGYIQPFKIPPRPTNMELVSGFPLTDIRNEKRFYNNLETSNHATAPITEGGKDIRAGGEIVNIPTSRIRTAFKLRPVDTTTYDPVNPRAFIQPQSPDHRIHRDMTDPEYIRAMYDLQAGPRQKTSNKGVVKTNPLFTRPSYQQWFESNPVIPDPNGLLDEERYFTTPNPNKVLKNPFPAKPGVPPKYPPYFKDYSDPAVKAAVTNKDLQDLADYDQAVGVNPYLISPDFVRESDEQWPGYKAVDEDTYKHSERPKYNPEAFPRFPEFDYQDELDKHTVLHIDQEAEKKQKQAEAAKLAQQQQAQSAALANKKPPKVPNSYGPGKPTTYHGYGTGFDKQYAKAGEAARPGYRIAAPGNRFPVYNEPSQVVGSTPTPTPSTAPTAPPSTGGAPFNPSQYYPVQGSATIGMPQPTGSISMYTPQHGQSPIAGAPSQTGQPRPPRPAPPGTVQFRQQAQPYIQQPAQQPPIDQYTTPGGNMLPFYQFSSGGQVRRFDVGGVVPKYEQLPSYEYGGYSNMIGRQLINNSVPRYDAGGMIPQMPFQQQFAKMEAGQLGSVKEAFNRAITDPRTGRLIDPMTGQEIDSGYYQRQVMESYMNQHANPQALPSGVVDPTGTMPGGAQVAQQDATYVAPQIKARIPYYQAMYQKSAAKAANPKGAMKNIVPLKTRV